jgi:hypothetical protein
MCADHHDVPNVRFRASTTTWLTEKGPPRRSFVRHKKRRGRAPRVVSKNAVVVAVGFKNARVVAHHDRVVAHGKRGDP